MTEWTLRRTWLFAPVVDCGTVGDGGGKLFEGNGTLSFDRFFSTLTKSVFPGTDNPDNLFLDGLAGFGGPEGAAGTSERTGMGTGVGVAGVDFPSGVSLGIVIGRGFGRLDGRTGTSDKVGRSGLRGSASMGSGGFATGPTGEDTSFCGGWGLGRGSGFACGDEGNERLEDPDNRFSFSGGRTGRSGTPSCFWEARDRRSKMIEL